MPDFKYEVEGIVKIDDVIGRIEAEDILGVRPRTFARYLADGKLPQPVKTLADGTMLWLRSDLEALASGK